MASTDVKIATRTAIMLLATALLFNSTPAFPESPEKAVVVGTEDLGRLVARAQTTQEQASPVRPQVIVPIISADSYVFNLERHIGKDRVPYTRSGRSLLSCFKELALLRPAARWLAP